MLGPLMLGTVCAALGAAAAVRLRARCAYLRAWQRALTAMYASCAFARSTCAQILRAGAYDMPALRDIAGAVETEGADAAAMLESKGRGRLLRAEEWTVLLSVLRALSAGGRGEIGAAIAYGLERFGDFCRDSDRRRDADERLYVTLGLLSGVCVFLILW